MNPYFGAATAELLDALTRFEAIETSLTAVIDQTVPNPLPIANELDVLAGVEDAISDCRGSIGQINEAIVEARADTRQYAFATALNLRVGA